MANALFGYQNAVPTATLAVGSAEAGLGASQLQNDRGSPATAWQTRAGVLTPTAGAWLTIDTGSVSSTWRAFLLARTNLSSTATVRWRVGPAEAIIEEPALIALDYLAAAASGTLVTPAGYNFARGSAGLFFDKYGVLQSASSNVLRYDCDPVTGAALGALKEEQRTNSVRNPRFEGAVAGSPGTSPTNFSSTQTTGLNRTITVATTENGIPCFDIRITGTAGASGSNFLNFETTTGIAAVNGQTWTFSVYAKLIAGSYVGSPTMRIDIEDAAQAVLSTATQSFSVSSSPLGQARPSVTTTIANASAAYVRPRMAIPVVNATVYDFTIRVGAPQVEQGYGASSPVLPAVGTPAATTRSADREWVTGLSLAAGLTVHAEYTGTGDSNGDLVPIALTPASTNFTDTLYLDQNRGLGTVRMILKDSVHGDAATIPSKALAEGVACSVTGAVDAPGMGFTLNALAIQTVTATETYAAAFTILGCGGLSSGGSPGTALGIARYRKLAVYAKRCTAGQVVALSSTLSSLDATALIYDSGTVAAGVVAGFMQSAVIAAQTYTARYARVDITDSANPDGFLNIPLVYAGPVWQPTSNIAAATVLGQDSAEANVVTRGGQEYPVLYWRRRRWDAAFLGIRAAEVWASAMAMDAVARTGANILFVPDPASADLAREATFGRLQALADVGFPYAIKDRRSWRVRVTERL